MFNLQSGLQMQILIMDNSVFYPGTTTSADMEETCQNLMTDWFKEAEASRATNILKSSPEAPYNEIDNRPIVRTRNVHQSLRIPPLSPTLTFHYIKFSECGRYTYAGTLSTPLPFPHRETKKETNKEIQLGVRVNVMLVKRGIMVRN